MIIIHPRQGSERLEIPSRARSRGSVHEPSWGVRKWAPFLFSAPSTILLLMGKWRPTRLGRSRRVRDQQPRCCCVPGCTYAKSKIFPTASPVGGHGSLPSLVVLARRTVDARGPPRSRRCTSCRKRQRRGRHEGWVVVKSVQSPLCNRVVTILRFAGYTKQQNSGSKRLS